MNPGNLIILILIGAPSLWIWWKIHTRVRESDCVLKGECKLDPKWFKARCSKWKQCRRGK